MCFRFPEYVMESGDGLEKCGKVAECKWKGAGKSGAQAERTWLQLMSCTLICMQCPISELEDRAEHAWKQKKVSVVDILGRDVMITTGL